MLIFLFQSLKDNANLL